MINRLIELSLRNRFIVTALFIALAGWGWWAVKATPIRSGSAEVGRSVMALVTGMARKPRATRRAVPNFQRTKFLRSEGAAKTSADVPER